MNLTRKKLLRPHHLPFICFYCGEAATDKEHVIPKSLVGNNTHIVWSCRECNCIAGSKLFYSIEDKRDYIQRRIEIKYEKYLQSPDWKPEEILELGKNLRTTVRSAMALKKIVKNRLAWGVRLEVLIASRYLELAQDEDEEKVIGICQEEINAALKSDVKFCISEKDFYGKVAHKSKKPQTH